MNENDNYYKRKRKIWASHTAILCQPDVTQQCEPKLVSIYFFSAGPVVHCLTEVQHMSADMAPANATSFWFLETEVAEAYAEYIFLCMAFCVLCSALRSRP